MEARKTETVYIPAGVDGFAQFHVFFWLHMSIIGLIVGMNGSILQNE